MNWEDINVPSIDFTNNTEPEAVDAWFDNGINLSKKSDTQIKNLIDYKKPNGIRKPIFDQKKKDIVKSKDTILLRKKQILSSCTQPKTSNFHTNSRLRKTTFEKNVQKNSVVVKENLNMTNIGRNTVKEIKRYSKRLSKKQEQIPTKGTENKSSTTRKVTKVKEFNFATAKRAEIRKLANEGKIKK